MPRNIDRDTDLSRGFDAGNYASAYQTQYYTNALARLSINRSADYIAAFTLGFFSSYEMHEIPTSDDTDAYLQAYHSEAGKRVLELGYIDAREESEIE